MCLLLEILAIYQAKECILQILLLALKSRYLPAVTTHVLVGTHAHTHTHTHTHTMAITVRGYVSKIAGPSFKLQGSRIVMIASFLSPS